MGGFGVQSAPGESQQQVVGAPKLPRNPLLEPENPRHLPQKVIFAVQDQAGLWAGGEQRKGCCRGVNAPCRRAVPGQEGSCQPAPPAAERCGAGFAACKSAANVRHCQLRRAEGEGRLSGRASSTRCDAISCLEAEERQSSCHSPWGNMGHWHLRHFLPSPRRPAPLQNFSY